MPKSKGAKGINLAGMCCTANEMLMRHGVPIAGNFLQQELAIVTGALEAIVVDVAVHHAGPGRYGKLLSHQGDYYRSRAKIQGAVHMPFNEHHALESAKEIIQKAVDNYPNRRGQRAYPQPEDRYDSRF